MCVVFRIQQSPKIQRVYFAHTLLGQPTFYSFTFIPLAPLPNSVYTQDMQEEPYTKWSDRLAFDLALRLEKSGDDMDEILERHQVTAQDLISFGKDPVFAKRITELRDEIRTKGVTFRMKAKAQAEELLRTSWLLIHSPDVSAAVKADLIKSTVKWAGLEPKGEQTDLGGGGGVRIQINLGGESLGTANLVDATPLPMLEDNDDA